MLKFKKIFNEWNVYDIKTKQDANKKKLDDQNSANDKKKQEEEETNKYLLDIDKQLEDSKIAIMKDGVDKQVALIELEYSEKLQLLNWKGKIARVWKNKRFHKSRIKKSNRRWCKKKQKSQIQRGKKKKWLLNKQE